MNPRAPVTEVRLVPAGQGSGVREAVLLSRTVGRPLVIAAKIREPAEYTYFDEEVRPLLAQVGDLDRSACRAAVAERFSTDRMVAAYLSLYELMVNGDSER